jgi:probable DNA metabolism protein
MYNETIKDFPDWRMKARRLLMQHVPPGDILWLSEHHQQNNLLSALDVVTENSPSKEFSIPKEFLTLAQAVSCHINPAKWDWLYQALWRLTHGEKYLMEISTDSLMHKLFLLQKAVRRDAHKMKAFVRFRCLKEADDEFYIAWYRPDHNIARYVANFFKRRFSVMKWTIMTPDETVCWDGEKLEFSPGIPNNIHDIEDNIEKLWLTYYSSIFNPARIKIKAMKNEMPIRFWHGLPEAAMIPKILAEAPARVAKMLKEQEGSKISAADFMPAKKTLNTLREAASICKGCDLYRCARQTVFGEGPMSAKLIIVGEQPGLEEDKEGKPFVGPAGKMLREGLKEAKISAKEVYITNTVKHFKFEVARGRQLHRSPDPYEVAACKPWLNAEIEVIQPQLILCLGVTAAKALIKPGFTMKRDHGVWEQTSGEHQISATYHPSAILRAPTQDMKKELISLFHKDLRRTATLLKA